MQGFLPLDCNYPCQQCKPSESLSYPNHPPIPPIPPISKCTTELFNVNTASAVQLSNFREFLSKDPPQQTGALRYNEKLGFRREKKKKLTYLCSDKKRVQNVEIRIDNMTTLFTCHLTLHLELLVQV